MGNDIPECKVCSRAHHLDSPCPRRMANAILMRRPIPITIYALTNEEIAWMREHSDLSVVDVVEEAIVDLL